MSKFGIREEQRVALFIDGYNFYNICKRLGWDVDYKKLRSHFEENSQFFRANYFASLPDDHLENPLFKLVDWLSYNGYRVVEKPMIEYTDSRGEKRTKGSVQVEIAVEMLETAPFVDHMVLFSSDGNLTYAVEAVQRKGVKVTVVSTMENANSMSDDLRRAADNFVDLNSVKDIIFKRDMVRHSEGVREPTPLRPTPVRMGTRA